MRGSRLLVFAFAALLPVGGSVAGDVVLNEIAWMGTTTSPNDEWMELHNNTTGDIDLTGWTLVAQDGTPNIALVGTIPAHGFFLLERTDDTTVPGIPADQIYTGALENGGEVLELRDASNTLHDIVDAWYAGDNTTKETMDRLDPTAPGDQGSSWTNGPVNGTPMNSMTPVPAATASAVAVLAAGIMLTLFLMIRRR